MTTELSLYERIGGKKVLIKVHKLFYNKVYDHAWLKKYFADTNRETLESQQTNFMTQIMGGPRIYAGKTPSFAHQNMVICDELFEIRSQLLSDAIKESGVSDDLRQAWLTINDSTKCAIVKSSEKECVKSYAQQPILNFTR